MEQLPTELIAHIMKFLIPEVNPFLKFTTQGVHSSHLHPVSFSSSTTSSSSSSSAPAVVFPSSSSAALTSPRRSFLPSLHLLPHLHCKSRSGSWPSRGDGSGGGSRGKKRGKNSKNQRWWDDWQSLRLVCKNWNVIATDPRLIIHIRRHQEVFFAQIAEQAKRYSEMVTAIKNVAMLGVELTVEERNLLSRAYKHQISNKRESWERIVECEKKEKRSIRSDSFADHIIKYRSALEAEICFVCRDLLAVLDAYVIPHTVSAEARVFFLKMKGDYYRHLAEFGSEGEKKEAIQNAVNYFTQASDIAILELPPAHPIRLSLALNFSLFQYYILKQSEKACTLAKEAFDDAIAELDTLDEESYKNSSRTMQVLRDCLTFRSGANSSAKRKGRSKGGSEV